MEKRPALGKGLSALIPDVPEPQRARRSKSTSIGSPERAISLAATSTMRASTTWRARSRSNGVIQPIVVRKVGDRFHIIAGERRWRAAQKAGLLRVPVVVRDIQRGQRARDPGDGADRKHPARKPQSDRRGARLQAAQRRVRDDAGADRGRGREGSLHGGELPAPAQAAATKCAPTWQPARCRMGHARALLALPNEADQRRVARDVIAAACRCARPSRWFERRAKRSCRHAEPRERRSRPTCTCAPPKSGFACAWYAGSHRSTGRERPNRDRFRVRGRIAAAVRSTHGLENFKTELARL